VTTQILRGDCRDVLRTLPDRSVHCVVTSPPYFGLRDYRNGDQIGLETTPDAYVAQLVGVFRDVRRVLRDDGTLWLNLGSSYASGDTRPNLSLGREHVPAYGNGGKAQPNSNGSGSAYSGLCDECLDDFLTRHGHSFRSDQQPSQDGQPPSMTAHDTEHLVDGREPLSALPPDAPLSTTIEFWRRQRGPCSRCDSRAFGLSAVRSSSGDVPVSAHNSWLNYTTTQFKAKDMIPIPWLVALALQADGWYLRQDIIWHKSNPMPESVKDRCTKAHEYIFLLSKSERYHFDIEVIAEAAAVPKGAGNAAGNRYIKAAETDPKMRTKAGLADIGPRATRNKRSVWTVATQSFPQAHFATFPTTLIEPCVKAGCPEGGTVLDPFGGAGTTGLVADRLGRNAILIELNVDYVFMALRRLGHDVFA
jgi:DNA modification methylase